jgi:thymidylate synthase (FAD)
VEVKVLNKGFVRLVDVMGDDSAIVQAARVSYGGGTKSFRQDASLIDYLMRHKHTSPFEMVEFKFHSEPLYPIEGRASCFNETFSLSTGVNSGRSSPTR